MIFQWVFAGVFFGALILTWRRVRQNALRLYEGVFWSAVWAAGLILIWRPEATNFIANRVGIGRGADFIIYIAVISLFLCLFLLALSIDRVERQLTKLVQHQALDTFRRERSR